MFVDIGLMIGIYTSLRLFALASPQYDRPSAVQTIACTLGALAIIALTVHVVQVGVEATDLLGGARR